MVCCSQKMRRLPSLCKNPRPSKWGCRGSESVKCQAEPATPSRALARPLIPSASRRKRRVVFGRHTRPTHARDQRTSTTAAVQPRVQVLGRANSATLSCEVEA